jgi:transcriptional regulator with XRE-family HTH domain
MNEVMNSASVLYSRGTAKPFVAAVTLFGALVAGTGGFYSQNNTALVPTWTAVPAIAISVTPAASRKMHLQNISVPKAIRQIRNKLGLKMSEVADIFGVSRQAVYLWLEGGNLKPEYIQRIWDLSRVADQLQAAGIERPEHFIHRPLSSEGNSLLHLLVRGESVDAALSFLREQSAAEQRTRDRASAESQIMRTGKRDVSSFMELATPILEEFDG